MTRLVKIELKKLFSKKIIYIFLIVLFAMNIGTSLLERYVSKILNVLEYSFSADMYKQSMDSYDLSKKEEAEYYASDKTYYDTIMLSKDYKIGSAEYAFIYDEVNQTISCMNTSKYVDKDDEAYNECKAKYDEQIAFLKNFDWRKIVEDRKKETNEQIENVKTLLELGELSKEDADKQIKVLNAELETLEYRLKHDIPIDSSAASLELLQYSNSYQSYLDFDNDKNIVDYNKKLEKQSATKSYFIVKYKIDHELLKKDSNRELIGGTTAQSILNVFAGGLMPVLFLLLIAGGMVAEEYNKGTIKQLLLKPYTRTKILTSKVITVLITFTLFMFVYALMTGLINGIVFGEFSSIFEPVLIYDFNKSAVVEVNLLVRCIQLYLAILPMFLILFGISLLLSIITTNTSVALMVPLITIVVSSIISGFAKGRIFAFFPTMCWDLTQFLDGGLPYFKYSTLLKSLSVDIVTVLILFTISYMIFKKKDIKNQ